mgnify:CR=1 FL=1
MKSRVKKWKKEKRNHFLITLETHIKYYKIYRLKNKNKGRGFFPLAIRSENPNRRRKLLKTQKKI